MVAGVILGLSFSPNGRQLAISATGNGGATLDLELVDTSTGAPSVRVAAHRGSSDKGGIFDPDSQPLFAQIVYSADGRRVSSVASRAHDGAIATFDAATGAQVGASPVGADQTVLAVSPDLRVLVIQPPGNVTKRGFGIDLVIAPGTNAQVLDTSDGHMLTDFPLLTHELLVTPIAIDPRRPHVVYPSGLGTLAVADWSQFGAPRFASSSNLVRRGRNVLLSAEGRSVDMTSAMRRLGLASPDLPPNDTAPNASATWASAMSASGSIAVLTNRGITIWNPATGRAQRTLTGVPAKCASVPSHDLSFAGTAGHGRVVLGCDPTLLSWDLSSNRSTPDWKRPWTEARSDEPIGPMLTPDGTAIVLPQSYNPLAFLDAATGRTRAKGETVTIDNLVRLGVAPDNRTVAAVHWSGDIDLIDVRTGAVRQVLTSPSGLIVECGCGASPAVGFSHDGAYVALFHGSTGLEVWSARTGDEIGRFGGVDLEAAATGVDPRDVEDDITDFNDQLAVSFGPHDRTLSVTRLTRFTHTVASGPAPRYQIARTKTWSMRTTNWVQAACDVAGRDLSPAEWNALVGKNVAYHRTCTPLLAQ